MAEIPGMSSVIFRSSLFLLISGAAAFAAALDEPGRSLSSSRQFVIYGATPLLRSSVAMRAEDDKHEFLELLRTEDGWKLPIIVKFGPPPNAKRPPRFQFGVYEGEEGKNKIQLDIYDPKFVNEPEFDTQMLTALVLEYAYRQTQVKAGRVIERPIPWFVLGLAERIRTSKEGLPASLYSSLLSSRDAPRLGDFLSTQPDRLDPTSLAIFRAQASALLETLLALPDGRAGLRAYLSSPRRSPVNPDEIVTSFPSLGGNREALERKWVLAMARASAANRINLLTQRETAQQLDTILAVKPLPDPKHPEVAAMSGPYALPAIARSRNGRFILAQLENNLLRLSIHAHPLYKSLTEEYLRIVRELATRPKKHEDKRIAAAEQVRAGLTRETGEARDYVDWVEATKIQTENPEIDQAIEDVDQMEQPPARTDAISRYLDAISERGW